jgi:hypothetical protein
LYLHEIVRSFFDNTLTPGYFLAANQEVRREPLPVQKQ